MHTIVSTMPFVLAHNILQQIETVSVSQPCVT